MSDWNTRHTLIQRAQNSRDNETWEEFVDSYKKFIFYMLNQMQVPQNLIDDLAQEILLNLWSKLELYAKEKGKLLFVDIVKCMGVENNCKSDEEIKDYFARQALVVLSNQIRFD